MQVLAIYNVKGGVGKTSAAVNLAFLSAFEGVRTLLWDLDPQGAASWILRVRPRVKGGKRLLRGKGELAAAIRGSDTDGLDVLPADFSYRHIDRIFAEEKRPTHRLALLLQGLDEDYDRLLIDCAPGISLASEAVFVAADALLVPVVPTPLSMRTLETLRDHLTKKRLRRLRLLPFYSMVDRRKSLHRKVIEKPPDGVRMLAAQVPYSSLVEQVALHRAPLPLFAGSSAAAAAYRELWRETRTALGEQG